MGRYRPRHGGAKGGRVLRGGDVRRVELGADPDGRGAASAAGIGHRHGEGTPGGNRTGVNKSSVRDGVARRGVEEPPCSCRCRAVAAGRGELDGTSRRDRRVRGRNHIRGAGRVSDRKHGQIEQADRRLDRASETEHVEVEAC